MGMRWRGLLSRARSGWACRAARSLLRRTIQEEEMRHRWKLAAAVLVAVSATVLAAALGGGGTGHVGAPAAAREVSAASDRDSGEKARHFDRRIVTAASFGPNVVQGIFQGLSPAVSSLPGTIINPVTKLATRVFENLSHGLQGTGVTDPVVQSSGGTAGGLTGPISNFDGQCLPFGDTPCADSL